MVRTSKNGLSRCPPSILITSSMSKGFSFRILYIYSIINHFFMERHTVPAFPFFCLPAS